MSRKPHSEFDGSDNPACLVRGMGAADIAEIIALAATEATAPHWPAFEYQRMLNVVAEAPGRRGAWVLVDGRQLFGFAMASHVAGICDLEAVVVDAAWRRRGLGAKLVGAVAGWGEGLGARRLELEVRVSNEPALRLYRRMGFVVDGTRPGYYANPEEEAVLMGLELGRSWGGR